MYLNQVYAKWTIPIALLIAIFAERYVMNKVLRKTHYATDTLTNQKFTIVNPPRRIWIKPSNVVFPVYTELDDVETAILGGINLHLQKKESVLPKHGQPFKWAFVRDPSERAQAEYLRVANTQGKRQPFIKSFRTYALNANHLNQYLLSSLDPTFDYNVTLFEKSVVTILEDYHFIGIAERMDESLVVLKLLMDLEWRDILYLPPNDVFAINGTTSCVFQIPMFQKIFFLKNKPWKQKIIGDELLYQALGQSLELTINNLGKDKVKKDLQYFKELLQLTQHRCFESTTFACSINGERNLQNDCIEEDKGCGYICLNTVLDKP